MIYDVVIIGGGPAGLTAAIYSARYKLSSIVIVAEEGGYAALAHKICNFPSHKEITGIELMKKIKEQAAGLGAAFVNETVTSVKRKDGHFIISTDKNVEYNARKIIIATGTKRRKLNIPGEERFYGKGVSYCATCDAAFYKDVKVAVIGGSDASLTAALLLAEFAKEVYIIYRKEKFFRAEPMWVDAVENNKKIKTLFNENVREIKGNKFVNSISLESGKTLAVEGVFVEIGSEPSPMVFKDLNIAVDETEYIITDKSQKTSQKDIFAAGDITNNSLKQIVTAASEGAVAAYSVYKELASER